MLNLIINGNAILVIYVPKAKRGQKPVFLTMIYLVVVTVETGNVIITVLKWKLNPCSVMLPKKQKI